MPKASLQLWRGALQTMVAAGLASFLVLIPEINEVFNQSGYWAVSAAILCIEPTAGGSVIKSVQRIIGTALGGIVGWSMYSLITWDDQYKNNTPNVILLVLLCFLWPLFCGYFREKFPNNKLAVMHGCLVGYVVIIGAYIRGGALSAALARIGSNAVGISIAGLVVHWVFPLKARNQIIEGLAIVLDSMGDILEPLVEIEAGINEPITTKSLKPSRDLLRDIANRKKILEYKKHERGLVSKKSRHDERRNHSPTKESSPITAAASVVESDRPSDRKVSLVEFVRKVSSNVSGIFDGKSKAHQGGIIQTATSSLQLRNRINSNFSDDCGGQLPWRQHSGGGSHPFNNLNAHDLQKSNQSLLQQPTSESATTTSTPSDLKLPPPVRTAQLVKEQSLLGDGSGCIVKHHLPKKLTIQQISSERLSRNHSLPGNSRVVVIESIESDSARCPTSDHRVKNDLSDKTSPLRGHSLDNMKSKESSSFNSVVSSSGSHFSVICKEEELKLDVLTATTVKNVAKAFAKQYEIQELRRMKRWAFAMKKIDECQNLLGKQTNLLKEAKKEVSCTAPTIFQQQKYEAVSKDIQALFEYIASLFFSVDVHMFRSKRNSLIASLDPLDSMVSNEQPVRLEVTEDVERRVFAGMVSVFQHSEIFGNLIAKAVESFRNALKGLAACLLSNRAPGFPIAFVEAAAEHIRELDHLRLQSQKAYNKIFTKAMLADSTGVWSNVKNLKNQNQSRRCSFDSPSTVDIICPFNVSSSSSSVDDHLPWEALIGIDAQFFRQMTKLEHEIFWENYWKARDRLSVTHGTLLLLRDQMYILCNRIDAIVSVQTGREELETSPFPHIDDTTKKYRSVKERLGFKLSKEKKSTK